MDPLRIAVLASKHAEGVAGLLADLNRGSLWNLSIVIGADTELAELPLLEEARVPVELRPIRMVPAFRNLRAREDYDDEIGELLARLNIDYVLLAGYPYIVTNALLARFPNRVLALHDADLSRRDAMYAGAHAVRDAILAGENETRSSIYIVTRDVAKGPLFLLGGAYPIASMARDARERGDVAFLYTYAELHRRWMIETSWSAMLARALELLAGGTSNVIGDVVWIDGAPGPCRMGESPSACHEPEMMVARGIPRSCPFIG
ncbi:MAG: formyltransferase family protein [Thermoanaerobaculia bacterium]